jgi:serine protease Do
VLVSAVEPGSPAHKAQIGTGNMILGVNRQVIRNTDEFNKAFAESAKTKRVLLRLKDARSSWFILVDLD